LDVNDVDVTASGEIEINIRNTAGTGYEWELQQSPPPNTVTLLEGPVFIESSELPGALGVTRFRFKVDENPNRGFTLFFQLKRPWEEAPIKKFHVRFNAMRS
jgi:predicted secreted protein